MSKLSLKLEDLRVESFSTADGAAVRGTVHARESVATGDDPACVTFASECTLCGECTHWQSCRSNCYESCVVDC